MPVEYVNSLLKETRMPYYLHDPQCPPETGESYAIPAEAGTARKADPAKTLTFIASASDQYTWWQREQQRFQNSTYIAPPWQAADWNYELRREKRH